VTRGWVIGAWSIGLCGAVLAKGQVQQPVFRASTDLVAIDVLVQRRGNPVTNLTAADFELLDNGVRQQVTLEGTDAVPVDVTMVFDERYYAAFGGGPIGPDLRNIAERLRPIDRLRVILLASEVREVLPMAFPSAWPKAGLPELTARRRGAPSAGHRVRIQVNLRRPAPQLPVALHRHRRPSRRLAHGRRDHPQVP